MSNFRNNKTCNSCNRNTKITHGLKVRRYSAVVTVRSPEVVVAKHSRIKVRFGSTYIIIEEPSASSVRQNIREGQKGLARALKTIVKPGIKIKVHKGVPLFHADPEIPVESSENLTAGVKAVYSKAANLSLYDHSF